MTMIQTIIVVLVVLPFLGFIQAMSAATLINPDDHALVSMSRSLTHRSPKRNLVLRRPLTADVVFDSSALRRSVAAKSSLFASHTVLWGSNPIGCNYTLPKATISCGKGGVITLIEQDPSVQSCVASSSKNSLVCAAAANPLFTPTVTVLCTGTTVAATAATLHVPASAAKCVNKLSSKTHGGSASVFASIGRYCAQNGNVFLNTNYACTSGVTNTTGGLHFCLSQTSCKTSSASCLTSLRALTVSDTDSRAECLGKGPNATSVPFSIHDVTWGAVAETCTLVDNTVTITCGKGGFIALQEKNSAVSGCKSVDSSTLKCTKLSSQISAEVVFGCAGRGVGQLDASAVLPTVTASKCTSKTNSNDAFQVLYMDRYCGLDNLTAFPSAECGKLTELFVDSTNTPFCGSLKSCNSTSKAECSNTLSSISITDVTADPTCIFLT